MAVAILTILLAALAAELALRVVWARLPEPNRYCQAMYGPKIKRMQALADGPPIDIVIVGHSATAIGFDPKIVLEHLPEGATCFNAAVGLANMHIQERFLPEYVLPLLRPRVVIIGTNCGALNAWEPSYEERKYDKAWATSKTLHGTIRRAITSRSRLLDFLDSFIRDGDYRQAIARRLQRKNGLTSSQRVDKFIDDLGHRVPLRPVSDQEQLAAIDTKHEVSIYEPGPYKIDSWLRLRELFDTLPDSRFVSLMMPSSPRRTARRQNGIEDQRLGVADWSKFCEEQGIFTINVDDGSYTDDEYGDLDHPLWPAVRRQSNALGEALAEHWEELMNHSSAVQQEI